MKKLILIAVSLLFSLSVFAQAEHSIIFTKILEASEEITGEIKLLPNETATVTLTADSCRNIIHVNDDADAIEYDLPVAERGLLSGWLDDAGGVISLDPNGTEYIVVDGTSAGAGTIVASDGTRGRYAVLVGRNGYWVLLPTTGWE
jgi:hypothetical protein